MSFLIGAAIWLGILIIPKVNEALLKQYEAHNIAPEGKTFLAALSFRSFSKSNVTVTFSLIGLNVLVFVIMVFAGLGFISFDGRDLLAWGADYRPKTANGEWWRLFTSMFLHGGLVHLFGNMYGLIFAGIFLEPLLGKLKYASAYLICGLVSSLASIWWHPATISIGASGAIFGLYGVLAALLTTNTATIGNKKGILGFCLVFVVLNLVIGLTGGIDNAAHVGGLLCGLVIGYLFHFFGNLPRNGKKEEPKEETTGY